MVLQYFVGALIFGLVTLASGKPQMKQSYHENTHYGNDGGNLPFSMTQCIWENQYYDIGASWTKPGECKVYSCEMGSAIIQKVHQPAPNLKWRMCSVLPIGNGCWQVEGPAGAPFPECCPSVQCAGGLPNGGGGGGGYNVFY